MNERQFVKSFTAALEKYYPGMYIFVDKDSPGRAHRGEWDFVAELKTHSIFVEAKISSTKIKRVENPVSLLRDSQRAGKDKILASGGWYVILIFYPELKRSGDRIEAHFYTLINGSEFHYTGYGKENILQEMIEILLNGGPA